VPAIRKIPVILHCNGVRNSFTWNETAGELLYRKKLNNKGCDVPVSLEMSDHNEIFPPAVNTPCTQLLFFGSAVCAVLFFTVL